jgi:hypothetical protein
LELAVAAVHQWGVIPNLALHLAFLFLFSGLMVGIQSMALQAVGGFVKPPPGVPSGYRDYQLFLLLDFW